MNQKKYIFGVIFTVVILLVAGIVYYFRSPESPSNFRIVAPVDGQRVGSRLDRSTYTTFTDLIIYYNGPDPEVIATITQSGFSESQCRLVSGLENTCYDLKLSVLGQNQFTIFYQPSVGDPVIKNIKVYWKPYNIFEIFASFVGGGDLTVGFLRIMFVVLIVSIVLAFTKTKNPADKGKSVAISAWVVVSFTTFCLVSNGPGSTIFAFYGTILLWIIISYIAYRVLFVADKPVEAKINPLPGGKVLVSKVENRSSQYPLATRSQTALSHTNKDDVVEGEVYE